MFRSVLKEEIQVPANIDYLGELRNFVTKAGRKHNFSDTIVNAFKLSIDEAATNIIKHAYRDWEGMIKMRIIIKSNSMTVLLIDQGKYFDPSRVKNPDLDRYVNIGKKGGLGIFIMRKLIDEIEYRHTEEGNELRLTKYKGTVLKKKKKIPTPSLSVSIKTRYSGVTALVLTIAVMLVYFYAFFRNSSKVMNEFVKDEKPICETIAKEVLKEGQLELNPLYVDQKMREYTQGRNEIFRVVVTDDSLNVISSTDESLVFRKFEIPEDHEIPRPGLISYKSPKNENIYSFHFDIVADESKIKVGTVNLEIKGEYVSGQIWSLRLKDLQIVAPVLLFGYLGIIFLVYFILNPFRKLATWVKELGHGDVKDEIDFDANDEVGEIAKAFSDITDTLRDSQKNMAEQERIQKEMQLAQDIQQTLLPSSVPVFEGYEIASFYEAAKEVGGDYYDFIEVDKDTLGIVVADVSGKGVPGSLIMTMIRTALRTEARSIKSASEVLARVNDFVVNDMKKGMFVTLFYIIIDSKKRRINYASAGHNPMILFRRGTQQTYYLNPRGFPVGISLPDSELFKKSIESDTIQLTEDDILIIYTDGITEAMNNRRSLFGEERLQQAVKEYGQLKADEFIEKLKDEIHTFTEGHEQNDDITLVAIKEQSTPEKIELKRAQKAHKLILQGKNIRDACEECGITVYAYYNKFKKIFEEEGVDAIEIDETISVESKHLSIEEKTKIYDIIKLHPEYGTKRISEDLNTERYSYSEINENRIYDELVRSRLNTRQLREAYIARSGRKKRMKPPGTPMLTLDGKIILDKRLEEIEIEPEEETYRPKTDKQEDVQTTEKRPTIDKDFALVAPSELDENFYLESLMAMPLEDLLKKNREDDDLKEKPREEKTEPKKTPDREDRENDDIIFEELIDDKYADADKFEDIIDFDEDLELHKMHSSDSDADIEEDISFADIWEQGEPENDFDVEKELEQDLEENETKSDMPKAAPFEAEENAELNEISKPTIDIDEILNESIDDETDGFEMLTDETSFKDELLISSKNIDEKMETDKDGSDLKMSEIVEEDSEDTRDDIEKILLEIEEQNISENTDELLSGELVDFDFTFNDLLSEIENDIAIIEDDNHKENDTQTVLVENKPKNEKRRKSENKSKNTAEEQMQNKSLLMGLKFYREKNYERAIEQFVLVTKIYPDFKEAYSILGNAYYHLNIIDRAIETYQKVKELDPHDTDSYENTGVIYANQGKLDEAIQEWKVVMELNPKRKDILAHIEEAKQIIKKQ